MSKQDKMSCSVQCDYLVDILTSHTIATRSPAER